MECMNTVAGPGTDDWLVDVQGLSKRFCRNYRRSLLYGLRDVVGEIFHCRPPENILRTEEFWAVKDVSFVLRRGEAIGIVGKNGSGKTTLLRMLAGVINPTAGTIRRKGRLAPMLALGAGFNPVLTGRENIFVNMTILGCRQDVIRSRFEDVVEFSGIRESLDAPVQNYSSGMIARLGFACAVHTAPDVMLVDEVMAVGDWFFQEKCRAKIREMREAGTAFLIINHAPQLVVENCKRALYLSEGRCVMTGDAKEVIQKYEEDTWLEWGRGASASPANPDRPRTIAEKPTVTCLWEGETDGTLSSGRPATARIRIETPVALRKVNFLLRVEPSVQPHGLAWKTTGSGQAQATSVLVAASYEDGVWISELPVGESEVDVRLAPLGLTAGHYRYLLWGYSHEDDLSQHQFALITGYFQVTSCETLQGSNYHQPRSWTVRPGSGSTAGVSRDSLSV